MPPRASTTSDDERLTPAAERVLARAGRIAVERGERCVEAVHLLTALVEDESRGAELLAERGFDVAVVRTLLAIPASDAPAKATGVADESGDVRMVRLEALRFARLAGVGTVGSEHLLFALAVVPSAVSDSLAATGLDEATALALSRRGDSESSEGEPLDVDCELRFEGANSTPDFEGEDERAESDISPPDRVTPGVDAREATLDVHRIVDAAANRAREGLRVAEDYVRFVLDDAHLVSSIKELRHDLAAAMASFDRTALLHARDTPGDVGTTVTTTAEGRRGSAEDVLRAALARGEEALRTLEEFGKLLAPEAGPRFESLRYRLYTVEKTVLVTIAARASLAGRGLYLLLTRDLCRLEPEVVVCEAIRGGVSIVQLREKAMPDREFLDWAKRVRRWTRDAGALLVVNDRPDLALLCDADGVHVGQEELTVRQARRILGPDRLVGVSTHDLPQARRAVLDGADYLGVGPTFPSRTKSFDGFAGLEFVRGVAAEIGLPWYAIGGIDSRNVGEVVAAGGSRIAVTGAVCAAEDPAAVARELSSSLPTAVRGARSGVGSAGPASAGGSSS